MGSHRKDALRRHFTLNPELLVPRRACLLHEVGGAVDLDQSLQLLDTYHYSCPGKLAGAV